MPDFMIAFLLSPYSYIIIILILILTPPPTFQVHLDVLLFQRFSRKGFYPSQRMGQWLCPILLSSLSRSPQKGCLNGFFITGHSVRSWRMRLSSGVPELWVLLMHDLCNSVLR
ncbi:hypothetical protein BU24DRAFT_148761 [Aaosphaeria arxii CBS 175.79]|uniref:Uncharacterized protein n=1 Tax=Aaosphaeria arxii CBS 175.79 TaxID=1450172 RepID=A0A6A5XVY8_9PLEO|nr:uncharacterized protein BU24DRAFT_148761 [Aaosphaeria arxii CBS 175.79]KAF2017342.1 hypothetical protein BU24DRAFT_148761 [Aaosphaeria arxii CBS 175.79]